MSFPPATTSATLFPPTSTVSPGSPMMPAVPNNTPTSLFVLSPTSPATELSSFSLDLLSPDTKNELQSFTEADEEPAADLARRADQNMQAGQIQARVLQAAPAALMSPSELPRDEAIAVYRNKIQNATTCVETMSFFAAVAKLNSPELTAELMAHFTKLQNANRSEEG